MNQKEVIFNKWNTKRNMLFMNGRINGDRFRKITKTKLAFLSDSSLEKILYLASMNAMKK